MFTKETTAHCIKVLGKKYYEIYINILEYFNDNLIFKLYNTSITLAPKPEKDFRSKEKHRRTSLEKKRYIF